MLFRHRAVLLSDNTSRGRKQISNVGGKCATRVMNMCMGDLGLDDDKRKSDEIG